MTRPRRELPRGAQHVLERVGRVRVVDDTGNGCPSSTVSNRPGTPRQRSMPRATASSSTPSSRAPRRAPSAFSTLKRPRSREVDRRRARSAPTLGVVGEPERERVPAARAASRRPYASPTFTAAAARLREEPPLRGEVRLHRPVEVEVVLRQVREDERREADAVEAAAAPSAIDVASITQARSPASSISPEQALQVDRLRRVQRRPAGARRRRGARSSPSSPGRRPAASRIAQSRNAVVVLPFVPVTPATGSSAVGSPKNARPRLPSRARTFGDDDLGDGEVERPLDDERGGAGRDRVRREVVPVDRSRGTQKKSVPGRTARMS